MTERERERKEYEWSEERREIGKKGREEKEWRE